jgi:hypothetical protein
MNKPAFVFDGRNILKRQELKDIGFKVSRLVVVKPLGPIADRNLCLKVVSIGTGDRL